MLQSIHFFAQSNKKVPAPDCSKVQFKYNLLKEIISDPTYLNELSVKEKEVFNKKVDNILDKLDFVVDHSKRKTRRLIKKECNPF